VSFPFLTSFSFAGWIPKQSLDALRRCLALQYPELAASELASHSQGFDDYRLLTSFPVPVSFTRMCWYSDTTDGNWVIDYHPKFPSLLYATGGAGHAFKVVYRLSLPGALTLFFFTNSNAAPLPLQFLPIIGDLIRSRLEDTLPANLKAKWSFGTARPDIDPARVDMVRKPLVVGDLAKMSDLAPRL
jgi:sarcosine oxidase/L-pipecolate oxidase